MKAGRLLLQQPYRHSLQPFAQASRQLASGAILLSNHDIDQAGTAIACHRSTIDSAWLRPASQNKPSSPVNALLPVPIDQDEHTLLRSESPDEFGQSNRPPSHSRGITDHEYQTRVGKACRVIIDSLPDFMHKGVVDIQDLEADDASTSSSRAPSAWSAKNLLPSLSPFLGQSLLRRSAWSGTGKGKSSDDTAATTKDDHEFDSLYHPSIAFEFRPPLPHLGIGKSDDVPANGKPTARIGTLSNASDSQDGSGRSLDVYDEHARGGPTICFNGRTLYVASSHLLRHALSALFHDTSIHLESARFEGRSKAGSSWPGISSYVKRSTQCDTSSNKDHADGSWQDKLVVRLRFEGISRVTSHPHTYTVIFKYEFDRNTGMVAKHLVDNIQPVPGSKVWAGLSHAWGALSPAAAGGGTAACSSASKAVGCGTP